MTSNHSGRASSDQDRYRGCLLGLACGDAVGTTVEFKSRGSFAPVTDMTGGGPFRLEAGQWTDDTSMALCLAASLLHCQGFDAQDQMDRYVRWRDSGYMSSTGRCFDIGTTVSAALSRYLRTNNPFAGSPDPRTAGNGALMRLGPVPMYFRDDQERVLVHSAESTRVTHGAQEAIDCSRLFGLQLRLALLGRSKDEICAARPVELLSPKAAAIAEGNYKTKSRDEVVGSGYCIESLEAALWCFWHTSSYEHAVLEAVNLGLDADTTAAICGQLAGAYHGVQALPANWVARLAKREMLEQMADDLLAARVRL